MPFSFSPSVVALPDQPVVGPARGVQYDEFAGGGKLVPPALVGSDPAWNQSGFQVVNHRPGGLVDVESSKVGVETGEHLPHIVSRRRGYRSGSATIRYAAHRPATGVHQLYEHSSRVVIQKPSEWSPSPGIRDCPGDLILGLASDQLPHPYELLAFGGRTGVSVGEWSQCQPGDDGPSIHRPSIGR